MPRALKPHLYTIAAFSQRKKQPPKSVMASSLASCVSAAIHAPGSVQNFKNSRRPNKDVNGGGVDTTKSSRRRFGKLRQRGEMCIMHDVSVAPEELERTSRNAGPRSVHFPASAGYDAPWISHRADEVPVSPQQSNIVHCIYILAQFNALSNYSFILLLPPLLS